jgi:ATP-dependent Clp protease ATP-binding subunit ClpA
MYQEDAIRKIVSGHTLPCKLSCADARTLQVEGLLRPEILHIPGPSGTGKSTLVRRIAQLLGIHDTPGLLCVTGTDYSHAEDVSKLGGAAPGYVGFDPNETLPAKLKAAVDWARSKDRIPVLFFDELDKAHPQLNNYLMQLFDGILQHGLDQIRVHSLL